MKTIEDQIKQASNAYIIPLNEPRDGMATHRYAVYLQSTSEMEVIWPSDSHLGKSKEIECVSMSYTKRKEYPAYHFALSGCGYSKTHEIACRLQHINKGLTIWYLTGWSPSLVLSAHSFDRPDAQA